MTLFELGSKLHHETDTFVRSNGPDSRYPSCSSSGDFGRGPFASPSALLVSLHTPVALTVRKLSYWALRQNLYHYVERSIYRSVEQICIQICERSTDL